MFINTKYRTYQLSLRKLITGKDYCIFCGELKRIKQLQCLCAECIEYVELNNK